MWRLDAGTVLSRLAAPCRLMRLCPLPNARKISQAECVCLIGGSYGTDPVDPKGSHPAAAVRKEQSGSFTLPHVHQIIRYCGSNGSFGLYTSQFTSFFGVSESQDSNSFFFLLETICRSHPQYTKHMSRASSRATRMRGGGLPKFGQSCAAFDPGIATYQQTRRCRGLPGRATAIDL